MLQQRKTSAGKQSGFGLVEIMVGLVIGLFTTLVIMQVFSVFEGGKRTTTGAADAQTSGAIALYEIGRDLQMAGFGLIPEKEYSPLECNNDPKIAFDHDEDPSTPDVEFGLSPMLITDPGDAAGASDTLTVRYGNTAIGGVPTRVLGIAGSVVTVDNNLGCQIACPADDLKCPTNNIALVVNSGTCFMTRVTEANAGTPTKITLADATGANLDANLACLGRWQQITYSVSDGNLLRNGTPIIAGIINLQAQYGISDSATSNRVTQWVNATGSTWATPALADRNRIKSIRLAVVARNPQLERDDVSTACSSLDNQAPSGLCAWDATSLSPETASPAPKIDLSNDPDWQRYRYSVFETVIPLRNIIWSKDSLLD